MKFLQHGDSVVSLRFLYQEAPSRDFETTESLADNLTFDTVREIQDALGNLFEDGKAPFNLQEDVLDLDQIRASGNYPQADMVGQLAAFKNNLNATLSKNGELPDISDFMGALQEFMSARALDLSAFSDAANDLMNDVKQDIERTYAGANARIEMAELADLVTAKGLSRDAKLTESGKRPPDQPVMAVASTVAELPQEIAQVLASLDKDTAEQFGASAMAGFSPDQFA